ncbi:MAG: hypothetical protein IJL97_02635, partial [Lachnospiraceae bacterium]|nr:hypothetical protein [Lachnospiraceae bacterium]
MKKFLKWLLLTGIIVCVFFVSEAVSEKYINRNIEAIEEADEEQELPIVYAEHGGRKFDPLYGFVRPADSGAIRSSVIPVNGPDVSFDVQTKGHEILNAKAVIRDMTGSTVITELAARVSAAGEGRANVTFTPDGGIVNDREYCLELILTDAEVGSFYYYTRLKKNENYLTDEMLSFVAEFCDKTFDKEKVNDLNIYMESYGMATSDLAHLDIHSTLDALSWGALSPQKRGEKTFTFKEIGADTASIELEYQVSVKGSGDVIHYYDIDEFYRIRWTEEKVY